MTADRLAEVMENHIKQLKSSLGMMETGKLKMHHNGKDITDETIAQTYGWIADLENALERHRMRNA